MAAADARAALSRSRVVARALVYAAQVVGLAVLLRAFADFPWVAAAAASILRFAAYFLVPHRFFFVVVNILVIILAVLFAANDDAAGKSTATSSVADPSGSPNSNGVAPEQTFLEFLMDTQRKPEPSGFGEQAPPAEEVIFEDKEAVHVQTVRAQPPRRTMSEKTRGAAEDRTSTARAASPELRRAKSENGRRRQRRSVAAAAATTAQAAAAAAAAAEPVTDDGDAFRMLVEAFIAKQQTLFREESLIITRAGARARAAGGEDGPAIAGAAVAVK